MAASSHPPVRILLLALAVVAAFVVFVRPDLLSRLGGPAESLDPCRDPLAWHLRSVDPRFGFTRQELERAVAEAADVWETAAGRQLFRHDTAGAMAIDLVYDQRQQASERRRDQAATLAELDAEVESLKSLLDRARSRAQEDSARYHRRPTEATERQYRASIDRYNGFAVQYNQAVTRYNAALEAARETGGMQLTAGDLRERGRTLGGRVVRVDRVLTVAVAGDYSELVVVLAHELGHARGLEHVPAPGALMAELYWEGDLTFPVELTAADRRALAEVCGLR